MTGCDASDLIRADLYPIADPDDPRRAEVIAAAKADLDRNQVCVLKDFITQDARRRMVADVMARWDKAYPNRSHRNCFLDRQGDPSLPEDHPRNIFFDASYRMMAYDLFEEGTALRRLYTWRPFREAVAAIVGRDELFLNEDPYQPANVLCYPRGGRSTWHFDYGNEFTTTLMLQASEAGGAFEIAPDILPRAEDDLGPLAEVLKGDRSRVIQVDRVPGSLVIFRGWHSVHRVVEVEGDTPRLMAVMVYEDKPGVVGRPEVNATVYGPRVAE